MSRILAAILFFTTGFAFGASAFPFSDSTQSTTNHRSGWLLPHYIPVQFAGNIGWLSAGIGYSTRRDNYRLSLVYGYAPKSIAGIRIHTITAKNIFPLWHIHISDRYTVLPYAACGISLEVGGRSFFLQPSEMPPGYYNFPKSLHFIPSAGISLQSLTERLKFFRGIDFFVEASTVDVYLLSKIMSDQVRMNQVISLSVGLHLLTR